MTDIYFFYPPTPEEREMVRLLNLIDAEWRSDPASVAGFDLRVVNDVRKILDLFKRREAKA